MNKGPSCENAVRALRISLSETFNVTGIRRTVCKTSVRTEEERKRLALNVLAGRKGACPRGPSRGASLRRHRLARVLRHRLCHVSPRPHPVHPSSVEFRVVASGAEDETRDRVGGARARPARAQEALLRGVAAQGLGRT